VGITVDGFVARSNGSIDYLPPAPATQPHQHPVCSVPTVSDMLGMKAPIAHLITMWMYLSVGLTECECSQHGCADPGSEHL
jgi:hypothetical protein